MEKLRIVGLIEEDGPGQLNNGAFGALPLGAAQRLFYRPGEIDRVDLILPPGLSPNELENRRLDLQADLGEAYAMVYPAAQDRRMTQMLSNYQIGLNFLSAMALFVGAFLIYNAFSMTVIERTREIGMLRAVGMTRGQVMRMILSEAALMGLAGGLMGLVFGVQLARLLLTAMTAMSGYRITYALPLENVAAALLIALLTSQLAAILPTWRAARTCLLEAIQFE